MVSKKLKKKRGPAPTGKGLQIGVRWHADTVSEIDEWRLRQEDKPPRAEAIRQLVQHGLLWHTIENGKAKKRS